MAAACFRLNPTVQVRIRGTQSLHVGEEQNKFVVFAAVGLILIYLPQRHQLTNFIIRIMYNNINSRLDATIIILRITSISSTCFGRQFRPSSGALDCVYSLWYNAPTVMPVGTTVRCIIPHYRPKHVELIVIINKNLLLLHPVGCLYYCINDARSHRHQNKYVVLTDLPDKKSISYFSPVFYLMLSNEVR